MLIKVYATLRELVGQNRVNVPVVGTTTVGAVLETLVDGHPALEKKLWGADGKLTGFVTVMLNGRSIEYLQGLATPVTDSDSIALFPPVGGG
jgi:sulfur-carrier protein